VKLSIIIPVFNEISTIKELVNRVKSVKMPFSKEIIIVDDGSTDGSRELIKRLGCKFILKDFNEGKGSAVIEGFKKCTGDLILIQDADLEYDPNEYPSLVKPIIDGECKVVYGSRFSSKRGNLKRNKLVYFIHLLGNSFLTFLTNLLFRANLTDMETCYKVFLREVIEGVDFYSKGFEFEPELTAKILKRGFKIKEVPINYFSRDFSEGKKITFIDGLKAFYYLFKFRFSD